ncbi:MAG: 2Fe-2S iron-sulfur cluster binding domain [Bacteroidetes bacterium]|nr:2Fe-2S iron-sulfur cluster binding domain [Bacteroidota bacterium]
MKEFVKINKVIDSRIDILEFDSVFNDLQSDAGQSILQAATYNDIYIPHPCLTVDCKLCKCKFIKFNVINKNSLIKSPGDNILTCIYYPLLNEIKN